jgi:hypothetical protein
MMRNSVEMGIMFNIIDTNEGIKADLVPLRRESDYQFAFERRIRREFVDSGGSSFSAWVAQPIDIIIGKLNAWDEGRSDKHPKDVYAMLLFDLTGSSDVTIDYNLISKEASHIGPETLVMWNQVLARAKDEVAKHKK